MCTCILYLQAQLLKTPTVTCDRQHQGKSPSDFPAHCLPPELCCKPLQTSCQKTATATKLADCSIVKGMFGSLLRCKEGSDILLQIFSSLAQNLYLHLNKQVLSEFRDAKTYNQRYNHSFWIELENSEIFVKTGTYMHTIDVSTSTPCDRAFTNCLENLYQGSQPCV